MRKSPVVITAALALLIASMAGVAYAHWTKTISVDGLVSSGTLDWIIQDPLTSDSGRTPDKHIGHGFVGPIVDGIKHVGTTTVWVDDDPHILHVKLENVYPCYFTMISFYPYNIGTIPIKVDELVVKDGGGDIIFSTRGTTPPQNHYFAIDEDGDGYCEVEFLWRAWIFGAQIHDWGPETSFWIHICEDAEQTDTYEFTFELSCINWNEYVPP